MKFIRDIVYSQSRLPDGDGYETISSTDESSLPDVARDLDNDQGTTPQGSPGQFADVADTVNENLPDAEIESDIGDDTTEASAFRDDTELLEDEATANGDQKVARTAKAVSSADADEHTVSFSRRLPMNGDEGPVAPVFQTDHLRPRQTMTGKTSPSDAEQPDHLHVPLRESSFGREANVPPTFPTAEQNAVRVTASQDDDESDLFVKVPAPELGRASNRGSRAKTRLLGFHPAAARTDPMARLEKRNETETTRFPVGWLVVTSGPGRGHQFTIEAGVAQIGRAEGQTIRLDFGDSSISRENHAAIAYDSEQNAFFVGHGGKANLVRRNDRPVLSTEELVAGDRIRVGETTLQFVPLCGPDFSWDETQQPKRSHAARG